MLIYICRDLLKYIREKGLKAAAPATKATAPASKPQQAASTAATSTAARPKTAAVLAGTSSYVDIPLTTMRSVIAKRLTLSKVQLIINIITLISKYSSVYYLILFSLSKKTGLIGGEVLL